ncbi:MAG: stage III sporulation protein AB [Oscillospiraceae bacterium]
MKLCGAFLLAAAGLWCGLAARASLSGNVKRCAELCQLLELLTFEIGRFRTPLPDFFAERASSFPGAAGDFCRALSDGLADGESLSVCWNRQMEALPPEERDILRSLGNVLGSYGAEEEVAAVDSALHRLTQLRGARERALREQGRVRVGLCSAAGVMLAVLLL